jgi:hypothetical protein
MRAPLHQVVAVLVAAVLFVAVPAWVWRTRADLLLTRLTVDQPDEVTGNQVHVMYVLPADGEDQRLDVNGALARSVASFQKWLAGQTGGRRLRMDTYGGRLEVTFARIGRSTLELAGYGTLIRDQIELELAKGGFDRPNKLYLVYYGGSALGTCGGGAWPPKLPGRVAAVYRFGISAGAPPCNPDELTTSVDAPGYREFSMIHEIMHTLGFVAECAPNHTLAGHVSDSPSDLMYAGPQPWAPSILDINRNDYYNHGRANCLDFARSSYLE